MDDSHDNPATYTALVVHPSSFNTGKKKDPWPWRAPFLKALSLLGVVTTAAERVGVERTTAYARRENHSDFAAAWDDALAQYADRLERTLFRDVEEGTGTTIDRIFALKGLKPEKYRDNYNPTVHLHKDTYQITFRISDAQDELDAPVELPVEVQSEDVTARSE
jgi:hypothetical protein